MAHKNKNKDLTLNRSLDNEKITLGRLMCLLSIALFLTGIVLDYFSAPKLIEEILTVRLAICSLLSCGLLFTFCKKAFLKHYTLTIAVVFLSCAFTIQYMIYITDPQSIAHQTYFAGLMLILITLFLATHISNISSIVISSIIITSFISTSFLTTNSFNLTINNSFFLASALIVGVLSNIIKNKFLAEKIHLQNRLKEALRYQTDQVAKQSELANFDSTTKLPNRRHGTELLKGMIEDADALGIIVIIMFIDLNKFKHINDTYGHKTGDEILKIAASRLTNAGRKSDILFRQGGDEFIFGMMLEKNSKESIDDQIENIINYMRESLQQPVNIDGITLSIDASIGRSTYPYNGRSLKQLIEVADVNMYKHKQFLKLQQKNNTISKTPAMPSTSKSKYLESTDQVFHMSNYSARNRRR